MPSNIQSSDDTVSNFSEKLDFVLEELAVDQKWLARKLRISASNISQWKKHGRIPKAKISILCKNLLITREILLLDKIEVFEKSVRIFFEKKGGVKWQSFVDKYAKDELELLTHKKKEARVLRGVYIKPQPLPVDILRLKRVKIGGKIYFNIPVERAILSDYQEIRGYACFLKDPETIHCLEYGSNFQAKRGTLTYRVPNSSPRYFHVSDPVGKHTCYLLLSSHAIPQDIQEYLEIKQIGLATDGLVEWLRRDSRVKFMVKKLDFMVTV